MTIRPTRARWATFAMFFSNGLLFGVWAAAIAPLKLRLELSPSALSLALLGVAIGAVVMMQFAGTLVVRLGGTGRATRLASFCYVAVGALPTLAPDLWTLAACTTALGAISGWMDVSMNAHAAAVEKQWGCPIMSSFHAGFSLGGLIGNGFGALIIACGVPTPFLMLPAAAVVAAIVAWAAPNLGAGEIPVRKRGAAFQFPDRALLPLALVAVCCFLVEGAMADWSGVYLTSVGVALAAAPAGYGAFSATMVSGRFLGDFMVRTFGRPAVVRYGAGLATLGLTLAVVWPTMPVIVGGFALVGLGLANVIPSVFSTSARYGKTPAAGIAAVSTAGYGGMLAGPPIIGAVADGFSLRTGVAVMAVMAAIAVIVTFFKTRQK